MKDKEIFVNKLSEISAQFRKPEEDEVCLVLQSHKNHKKYVQKILGYNQHTTRFRVGDGHKLEWYGFTKGKKYYQFNIACEVQGLTISVKDGKVVSIQLDNEGLEYVCLYFRKENKVRLIIRTGLRSLDRKILKRYGG